MKNNFELYDDMYLSEVRISPFANWVKLDAPLFMDGDDYSDDVDTTGVLILDGPTVSGVHETVGDDDWFAITLSAGDIIRISASGESSFLTQFSLIAPDGTSIDHYVSSLGGVQGSESTNVFQALVEGTYYVSFATTYYSGTNTNYEISVTSLADGTLTYTSTPTPLISGIRESGFNSNNLLVLESGFFLALSSGSLNNESVIAAQIVDPFGNTVLESQFYNNTIVKLFGATNNGFINISFDSIITTYDFSGSVVNNIDLFAVQPYGKDLEPREIFTTSDGDLLVAFATPHITGGGPVDLVLLKLSDSGAAYTVLHEQTYSSDTGQTLSGLIELTNGNYKLFYTAIGSNGAELTTVTVTEAGSVISNQTRATNIGNPEVIELADGGYVIVGSVNTGGFLDYIAFEIFNSDGSVRQTQLTTPYTGSGDFGYFTGGVTALGDGGFAVFIAGEGIHGVMRYSANGTPIGEPLPLYQHGGRHVDLELDSQGGLVIIYRADITNNGEELTYVQSLTTSTHFDVNGDSQNNLLYASLTGSEILGFGGDDHLIGNQSDDIIDGGAGNDTLLGGAGQDRFIFGENSGQDIVQDFASGQDILDLALSPYISFHELMSMFTDHDGYTVLNLGGGNSVRFNNMQADDFDLDDFALTGFTQDGTGPFRGDYVTLSEKIPAPDGQEVIDDEALWDIGG